MRIRISSNPQYVTGLLVVAFLLNKKAIYVFLFLEYRSLSGLAVTPSMFIGYFKAIAMHIIGLFTFQPLYTQPCVLSYLNYIFGIIFIVIYCRK